MANATDQNQGCNQNFWKGDKETSMSPWINGHRATLRENSSVQEHWKPSKNAFPSGNTLQKHRFCVAPIALPQLPHLNTNFNAVLFRSLYQETACLQFMTSALFEAVGIVFRTFWIFFTTHFPWLQRLQQLNNNVNYNKQHKNSKISKIKQQNYSEIVVVHAVSYSIFED